jgi:hypoxanthine phosphoribosyltransferase
MPDQETLDPRAILEQSSPVASQAEVAAAVARLAKDINAFYGDQPIILLAVMTGAIIPAAWLAPRLKMPLRMDFIHATRYAGQTQGGELDFRVPPRLNLQGHDILIVDDIYDVGLTLELIERYCLARGASSVNSAVLVRKLHGRETAGELPRFIGLDVPDKYVFGCGMDAHEHWRHLDEIRALEVTA